MAGADSDKTVVRLGLLLPMTGWAAGLFIVGAASLAVADINASPTLMQGRRVEYKWRDDGCSSIKGTTALSRMLEGDPIHAVIGATTSVACLPTGYLSAGRNVPQISSGCSSGFPSRCSILVVLCCYISSFDAAAHKLSVPCKLGMRSYSQICSRTRRRIQR